MINIYTGIKHDHDPSALLIAILICAFGSLIALSIGAHATACHGLERRLRLSLAGVVTGLTLWATHFAAMLGYQPGVEVRFNAAVALASASMAILMSGCGWFILATGLRMRGYLGGMMIGLALIAAHFIDMSALKVDGVVLYDRSLIALAIAIGLPLCTVAGLLIQRQVRLTLPLGMAFLTAGTVTLHLVAMSSVTIIPTGAASFSQLDLGIDSFTLLVIGSCAFVLLVGGALVLHDLDLARKMAADRERLRRSEEHHRFSVELSPQIPWTADAAGNIVEISPRWGSVVGEDPSQALGNGWINKVHPEDAAAVASVWTNAVQSGNGESADVRYRMLCADGSFRWFRARARARLNPNGSVRLWYGNLEDIDKQVKSEMALRESEERYRLASLAANDVIWDCWVDTEVVEWSGAVQNVLGFPGPRFTTHRTWWHGRLHPDDKEAVLAEVKTLLASERDTWTQAFRFRRETGDYIDLLSRTYVVRDADRNPVRIVGSLMDITARKRSEDELRWAAHHDPLTSLPNRKLFALTLDAALDHARTKGSSVGLVVIDVDGFKNLNDTLGHAAGDAALKAVASQLISTFPAAATVARLGGDEFAIVFPFHDHDRMSEEALEKLLATMGPHVALDGRQLDISLSAGSASFPRHGEDSEELLKSADLALYAAKADGVGKARRFDPGMREAAEIENQMRTDAREALKAGWIVPFYQPKICLLSGSIIGFEALLRLRHPERGVQLPGTIMAAFDDYRIAPELTDQMLTQIVDDIAGWLAQGLDCGRIAMNGSAQDFRRGDLTRRILDNLARVGVPASRFELEITERVFLGRRADDVESSLHVLREAGVTISLDDFGTGYASLTHLKQFPVDVLKIDQSFISRLISKRQQDALIVGALIDLAKNLGIQTVAEGIETELQAFMLRRRGCDIGQGHYFAHPLPGPEVPQFIAEWNPELMARDADLATSGDFSIIA